MHYANFLRVPLTSVDQQTEMIGERAANLALRLITSKDLPRPETVLLEPRLVVRQSTLR